MVETLLASRRLAIIQHVRSKNSRISVADRALLSLKQGQITHDDAELESNKRLCRESLEFFVRRLWHVVEPGREMVWNWHMSVICNALERVSRREIQRLLINVPPGHTKSLLVSVFWPAWNWLEDPSWGGFFASYSAKLSERDARKCRDLIQSEEYAQLLPRVYGPGWDRAWKMKDDTNSVALFETEYRGGRTTTSVTGSGTGFRATDIVIDDPMNAEEFPSMEALESVINWYNGRMSSRFRDAETGAIVLIMQRLHMMDLAGYIIEQDELNADNPDWPTFEKIVLPSEFNPEKANKYDIRTQKGELLFPARFSKRVLEEARIKLGPRSYAAQHDQFPVPASGGLLPVGGFCYWYPRGMPIPTPIITTDENGNSVAANQMELPITFDEEWLSVDCAFKDKKDSDFVVLQAHSRKGGNFFLLEQDRGRYSFGMTKDKIRGISARRRNMVAKYVEDKANGTAVIDDLKDDIPGLIAVDPQGGKESRAHAISYVIRAGNAYIPHPQYCGWVKAFIAECTYFPAGDNDDQVDAYTQGLNQGIRSNTSYLDIMIRGTKAMIQGSSR